MSIKYYPNRVFRAQPNPTDAITRKNTIYTIRGTGDANVADDFPQTISPIKDWKITNIKIEFDSATSRDFTVNCIAGRGVVENLNDFLFIQLNQTLVQKISIPAGFYTGTELATALEDALNNNVAFAALSATFTVTYDNIAGTYTIDVAGGFEVRYLENNTYGTLPDRYSIAGHLFGFNEDTSYATSIVSDTIVPGLDSVVPIIEETGNTDLTYMNDTTRYMSIDQALQIDVSTAAVNLAYAVYYQEILGANFENM